MKKSVAALVVLFTLAFCATALADEGPGTVTISPEPLALPPATVSGVGKTLDVTISYEGEGEAAIASIDVGGEDAAEFFKQNTNCEVLESGQSCTVSLVLMPFSLGTKAATLSVQFAGDRPTETRPLVGEAVAPSLGFSEESVDFGIQQVNTSGVASLELENTGQASVFLYSLALQGPDQSSFWIVPEACESAFGSLVIEAGKSCSLKVGFEPAELGLYAATLVATANGVPFELALGGEGGVAEFVASPGSVDFASSTVGERGVLRTIELTNEGNVAAVSVADLIGPDAGSFELVREDCSGAGGVDPGHSCSVQVRFQPRAAGSKEASLHLSGNIHVTVPLEGKGADASVGLSSSAAGDLGSQEVGGRGAARTFWFSNDGDAPVTVDLVALVGPDPDQFAIAGDECSGERLGSGEDCALRVRFAPDSAGPKTAKLRVSGGFGAASATFAATGVAGSAEPAAASAASPAGTARKQKRFARNKTIRAPKASKSRSNPKKRHSSARR